MQCAINNTVSITYCVHMLCLASLQPNECIGAIDNTIGITDICLDTKDMFSHCVDTSRHLDTSKYEDTSEHV